MCIRDSYQTTDLATIVEREKLFKPNRIIYVVDKRQEMHFTQVFRVSRLAELVPEDTKLQFLGFGTMNGKDGKPFKTRQGGVMPVSYTHLQGTFYCHLLCRNIYPYTLCRYRKKAWL